MANYLAAASGRGNRNGLAAATGLVSRCLRAIRETTFLIADVATGLPIDVPGVLD
jgi:hypothetical protein